jgi:hypothetical protein
MADDNPFQVIRDAIFDAIIKQQDTAASGGMGVQGPEGNADHYARAVLVALEHSGFEIVRHTPEPPDVD